MTKVNVYTITGTKKESISLPKQFTEAVNEILLAQAIHVYRAKRHKGLSKVKTRGEVRASTRKIWRQKGTGRARHGARSAPIFVGGGVAHGPKGKKRQLSLSKKMRQTALKVAFSVKAKAGDIVVVSGLSSLEKTKTAQKLIDKILKDKKGERRMTFLLSEKNKGVKRVIRNIKNVQVFPYKGIDAYRVFFGGVIVLDKEVLNKK
jgi:large subunit ribosomal protein L4